MLDTLSGTQMYDLPLFLKEPLLRVFLVVAIGYPLGRIRVRGGQIGAAAVLFVGLGASAVFKDFAVPEVVWQLGLAVFIYTIGISSARTFLASLRRDGVRNNILAVGAIVLAVGLTVLAQRLFHFDAALGAGLFSGSVTNTPALASAKETLGASSSRAVVAYSITYPMGVIGVVLAIRLARAIWRVDYQAEAPLLANLGAASDRLDSSTIQITHDLGGLSLEELVRGLRWHIIFGRIKRAGHLILAGPDVRFQVGDLVTAVGTQAELARVTERLGMVAPEPIDLDRSEFDLRRIFLSNPEAAGVPIKELDLPHRLGVVITRVMRGDVELLPHPEMRLEIGDRVRVLGPVKQLAAVSAFLGDSYRAASEIDILTFGVGLALGLLLGFLTPIGFAGGSLVVALFLGSLGRTRGMNWNLPFSANIALRQIGLILFLAAIGMGAGSGFKDVFQHGDGLRLFAAGAGITFTTAFVATAVGYRLLKIPLTLLSGMVAGIHTQPAVLSWAAEQTGNDAPNVGYASVYPTATIVKILLVQLLIRVC